MTASPFIKPARFTTPLGFRKDGRPVYLIGGGSSMATEAEINNPPAPPPASPTFTADDLAAAIEKARKEEKDKLYGRIETEAKKQADLAEQVKSLLDIQKAKEEAEAEAKRQAEAAEKARLEQEMSAKDLLASREEEWKANLSQTTQEWEQKFHNFAEERAQERAVLEKERQLAALSAYVQEKIGAERDEIAPELVDLITGNTPEEIDASIAVMKAKSAALAEQMREAMNQQQRRTPGVSATGYTTVPLIEDPGQRNLSAQDIQNMSMDDYAKYRSQLVRPASSGGLFG